MTLIDQEDGALGQAAEVGDQGGGRRALEARGAEPAERGDVNLGTPNALLAIAPPWLSALRDRPAPGAAPLWRTSRHGARGRAVLADGERSWSYACFLVLSPAPRHPPLPPSAPVPRG